jgi:chemotaxis protein MotA
MDLATLIGLVGALGIIVAAIATGGDIIQFIDVASILIVGGGSVMAVLMQFPLSTFLGAFKVALKAFLVKTEKPTDLISEALELANTARKNGLLALENVDISNEFLKRGIQLCVDGHDPEFVRRTLARDVNQAIERHD